MSEPIVKSTDPVLVAFVSMRGPYSQIPEGYGRLYGWAQQSGLTPTGMPSAVYLTDPATVPESEAAWELWAPVAGGDERAVNEEGLGVKRVPSMKVASLMYKGPYETLGSAYEQLAAWLGQQQLVPAGPPMETYFSDPDTTAPEEYLTEIMFPVQ